jgi:hypothetical protein
MPHHRQYVTVNGNSNDTISNHRFGYNKSIIGNKRFSLLTDLCRAIPQNKKTEK